MSTYQSYLGRSHIDHINSQVSPPLRGRVVIQKIVQFLPVIPDLTRHPEAQRYEMTLDSGSSPE